MHKKDELLADRLNEKIGVLTRRETEARILAPLIEDLSAEFGKERVLPIIKNRIVQIAASQGAAMAESMCDNSLSAFYETLQFWTKDDALDIKMIEQSDAVLAFDVVRCRYAELYAHLGIKDLGLTFSCARDFALINGFNRDIVLTRTQTIMEGAPYCDFRYSRRR